MPESDTRPTPEAQTGTNYVRADRPTQRRNRLVRLGVLTLGLVIITVLGIGHQLGWAKVVGVDALCPFGGIETMWSLIFSATFLQRVAASSVVLLAIVFTIAVVFRRSFCGFICPFGALQELFARAGSLLRGKRRPRMPAVLDRPARYLKYVVLAVFAVWSWQAAELVLRPYDPWVVWMHLGSSDLTAVFAEFTIGFVVLGTASRIIEKWTRRYLGSDEDDARLRKMEKLEQRKISIIGIGFSGVMFLSLLRAARLPFLDHLNLVAAFGDIRARYKFDSFIYISQKAATRFR